MISYRTGIVAAWLVILINVAWGVAFVQRDARVEELEVSLAREEERSLELESIVRTEINCPRAPLLRDVLDELDECLLREAE
jgi:hypothetical protein